MSTKTIGTASTKRKTKGTGDTPFISEADVRRAMMDAHSTLDDKQVFTSAVYQKRINAFARWITGRIASRGERGEIAVRSRVIWKEWVDGANNVTAYTNGLDAVVNAATKPIHDRYTRRVDKHYAIMGLAVHEFAHCKFTDFTLLGKQRKAIMAGKFYPRKPKLTPENENGVKGMEALLAKGPAACKSILEIYKELDNIIEDAYIEKSLAIAFPGDAKKALRHINEAMFGEDFMVEVKKRYASGKYVSKWALFNDAILTLLKLSKVNLDTSYNEDIAEISKRLEAILPSLERETENANHIARKRLCLKIILENWDFIEEDFKNGDSQDGGGSHGDGSGGFDWENLTPEQLQEIVSQILEQMLDNPGADHERSKDPNGGKPIRVFIELPEDVELPDMGDSSGSDGDSEPSASVQRSDAPVSAENTGETVTLEFGNDEHKTNEADGSLSRDLTNVEDELARQIADRKIESMLGEILQLNANSGKGTKDSWKILVNRASVTSYGETRYEAVWPLLKGVSRKLKKELIKLLETRRRGSRFTGQPVGRRMDARSLSRQDEKFFVKSKAPDNQPQVAVALLIDRSGSMDFGASDSTGQGLFKTKIQAASNAALVLYDFCIELGFPVMVCSHYVRGKKTVRIDSMAAFQLARKNDKSDRYRIAGAMAGGGNRDGTALNFALGELKNRTEEIKLLFIISDGLPADYAAGENGILHLQEVMDDARRNGVHVFAAALDEDIPNLKEIYGDGMFEISDLSRMPRALLETMRKFIK